MRDPKSPGELNLDELIEQLTDRFMDLFADAARVPLADPEALATSSEAAARAYQFLANQSPLERFTARRSRDRITDEVLALQKKSAEERTGQRWFSFGVGDAFFDERLHDLIVQVLQKVSVEYPDDLSTADVEQRANEIESLVVKQCRDGAVRNAIQAELRNALDEVLKSRPIRRAIRAADKKAPQRPRIKGVVGRPPKEIDAVAMVVRVDRLADRVKASIRVWNRTRPRSKWKSTAVKLTIAEKFISKQRFGKQPVPAMGWDTWEIIRREGNKQLRQLKKLKKS